MSNYQQYKNQRKSAMSASSAFITVLVLFSLSFNLQAQNTETSQPADTLVGLVVNLKGKPVKNVPVAISRKKADTKTDRDGIFVIPNASLNDTLTFLLPKSKVLEVPVAGHNFIKITLKDDDYNYDLVQAKEEIIHIGYGTEKRNNSSSSSSVISGDELRRNGNDILSALAGKVPGLRILFNSDGSAGVTLRGGTSTQDGADNSPLYVVDGKIVDSFNFVNINDVDKVSILKDGSMYGTRGANGVIEVTTKSGR
jgi:TonB-dependent SusC/RagA subfamily outer membrane receptor